MKNVIKILGIIAVVAVMGFMLVSCGEDNPFRTNQFKGTWVGPAGVAYELNMTDKAWTLSVSGIKTYQGTYTWSGYEADLKGNVVILETGIPGTEISGKATYLLKALSLELDILPAPIPFTKK